VIAGLSPSTVNILLGAGITVASTMVAWALLHFNQRRIIRDRTRRIVLHETAHIADAVEQLVEAGDLRLDADDLDRVAVALSTDVLNEDLLQINKLTSPEVEAIYAFYESAQLLERELDRAEPTDEGTEHLDRSRFERRARQLLTHHERIHRTVKRSRLSRFTEWYKEQDRALRNRRA